MGVGAKGKEGDGDGDGLGVMVGRLPVLVHPIVATATQAVLLQPVTQGIPRQVEGLRRAADVPVAQLQRLQQGGPLHLGRATAPGSCRSGRQQRGQFGELRRRRGRAQGLQRLDDQPVPLILEGGPFGLGELADLALQAVVGLGQLAGSAREGLKGFGEGYDKLP